MQTNTLIKDMKVLLALVFVTLVLGSTQQVVAARTAPTDQFGGVSDAFGGNPGASAPGVQGGQGGQSDLDKLNSQANSGAAPRAATVPAAAENWSRDWNKGIFTEDLKKPEMVEEYKRWADKYQPYNGTPAEPANKPSSNIGGNFGQPHANTQYVPAVEEPPAKGPSVGIGQRIITSVVGLGAIGMSVFGAAMTLFSSPAH